LEGANTEVEELQAAIRAAESSKGALQEKADQLAKGRRGCTCKKGLEPGSNAGRCTNCACARSNMQCNDSCGCDKYCQRAGEKTPIATVVEQRMPAIQRRARVAVPQESSNDDSESDYEPRAASAPRPRAPQTDGEDSDDPKPKAKKGTGKKK